MLWTIEQSPSVPRSLCSRRPERCDGGDSRCDPAGAGGSAWLPGCRAAPARAAPSGLWWGGGKMRVVFCVDMGQTCFASFTSGLGA